MTTHQHWIALLLAGILWSVPFARAQEETTSSGAAASSGSSSTGTGTSSSGASSAFEAPAAAPTPTTPAATQPGAVPPSSGALPPEAPTGPTAPGIFGTSPTGTAPPATGAPAAASTLGTGMSGPRPPVEPAASFTLPSAYGQAAQTFTAGEGRLARPRYRYSASLQFGYDDNVLQTPTKGQEIPEIRQEVLVDPGTPDQIVQVPVTAPLPAGAQPIFLGPPPTATTPQFRTVLVPGRPAKFETVVVQERVPAQERVGSFFARSSVGFEAQMASRRQIFTLDLRLNGDYYFSRPTDQTDFSGSLSFVYGRRLSPRMQFSATANLAYLSQPDVRRINTPTRNVGDYFNATAKMDLSYRWTKRFTTVSSVSLNSVIYMQETEQTGDNYETTFGTEARYLWSPRLTYLGEVRYSQIQYSKDPTRDSHTFFLLVGAETILSSRVSATLRLGESIRTFEESGDSASGPYAESTIRWRYAPAGFLSWNLRYGFEEPADAQSTVLALRTGLNLTHALSARMQASAGLTYIHRTTTIESADQNRSQDTFDFTLGFEYSLTRRLNLTGSYTYTQEVTDDELTDYYRNRIFFGAEYRF